MVSTTTVNRFFTYLLTTLAFFSAVQARLSCDDDMLRVFSYFRSNFEADLPTIIPSKQQIFICQHMAFNHFVNSTEGANMDTMNDIITSLCHLWVSLIYLWSA